MQQKSHFTISTDCDGVTLLCQLAADRCTGNNKNRIFSGMTQLSIRSIRFSDTEQILQKIAPAIIHTRSVEIPR